MLATIEIEVMGVSPLIMHNGQTADPMNKFSKELKGVSGKRKKTDEDFAEMARIEWHAGLYVNAEGKLIIPSHVVESCIIDGAKKSKLGKQFKSAVFVNDDCLLDVGIKYGKATDLWNDDRFRDTRGVRVNQARVMRTRPIFHNWSTTISVCFDDEQVNESEVRRAVDDAGSKCGLCDYRPKFGRFEVVE